MYASAKSKTYQINTPYYQGDINSDAQYGTFSTKDLNGQAYQPDNVGAVIGYDSDGKAYVKEIKKLKSSGKTVGQMYGPGKIQGATGANLDNQTVWQYGNNYYIWDGSQNQYIKM